MSSKNKDTSTTGKIKCSDFVETVSDAILKILRNSSNDQFLTKCLASLQVNTPVQAEKRIKYQLWRLLDNDDGSLNTNQNYHEHPVIAQTEYSIAHDYNASLSLENNNQALDFSDSDSQLYLEHYSRLVEEHHPLQQETPFLDSELLHENGIYNYNTSYATQLTSTPVENSQQSQPVSESQLNLLMVDLDSQSDSEVEILRHTGLEDDFDNDNYSDDIEYSWDSLNLSDIPSISRPSATDPSVHFSNPDLLSESYLLRDIPDFSESLSELDGELSRPPSINESNSLDTVAHDKNVDPQYLVARALSIVKDSIIADFDLQENDIQFPFIEESFDQNLQKRIINEYAHERAAFASFDKNNEVLETCANGNKYTDNISSPARSNLENSNDITVLFDAKKYIQIHRSDAADTVCSNVLIDNNNTASSSQSQCKNINNVIAPNDSNVSKDQIVDTFDKNKETSGLLHSDFDNIDDTDGSYECYFELRKAQDKPIDECSLSSTDTEAEISLNNENDLDMSHKDENDGDKKRSSESVSENKKQMELDEEDFIW